MSIQTRTRFPIGYLANRRVRKLVIGIGMAVLLVLAAAEPGSANLMAEFYGSGGGATAPQSPPSGFIEDGTIGSR